MEGIKGIQNTQYPMMETKTILYKGALIRYCIHGSGRPVMLIHGFGEDSSIWEAQVSYLKENFLLIVPDLPGSGASEMLRKDDVQIADYAEVMKAILKEEKINSAVMIGHSMGGYITLQFAKKYPELLNAFGLFHSGAYADDEEKIRTRKKAIAFIREKGSKAFLKTSIPGLFYDAEKSKNHIEALIEKGAYFSQEALIQYYEAMIARPDTTDILKDSVNPILFIIGEHDKAIPFPHSLQQAHLPDYAYIHILRHSAHMGMLEETGKANTILAQFLQSA